MDIIPLHAFSDNFIWLLRAGRHAVVVDPGDAAPVQACLAAEGLQLAAILTTHHHDDHAGGVAALTAAAPVPVYGPRDGLPVAGLTHPVGEGDVVTIPEINATFEVLHVPGHTAGHLAYYAAPALFCGDTLFASGCGRVFDGTLAQLFASLARIAELPDDTQVYCAHEYTLSNLKFAAAVEPDNPAIAARVAECQALRARDLPTVPFRLGGERLVNPFLRSREPAVIAAARAHGLEGDATPAAVFAAIRGWKNRF
ncbi:MAG TPA: hydroxyacylglutathione hydrolase [Rhodocyclaceae bacterium]|nr:hydroxyacylglutathione hydrolase [Rhodocyclaceae bacterium]HMW52848.1 hydroxyacylglutathione hydrolase [Rhodocyclaceae bacterium]